MVYYRVTFEYDNAVLYRYSHKTRHYEYSRTLIARELYTEGI